MTGVKSRKERTAEAGKDAEMRPLNCFTDLIAMHCAPPFVTNSEQMEPRPCRTKTC
jgi:hypothetical protein